MRRRAVIAYWIAVFVSTNRLAKGPFDSRELHTPVTSSLGNANAEEQLVDKNRHLRVRSQIHERLLLILAPHDLYDRFLEKGLLQQLSDVIYTRTPFLRPLPDSFNRRKFSFGIRFPIRSELSSESLSSSGCFSLLFSSSAALCGEQCSYSVTETDCANFVALEARYAAVRSSTTRTTISACHHSIAWLTSIPSPCTPRKRSKCLPLSPSSRRGFYSSTISYRSPRFYRFYRNNASYFHNRFEKCDYEAVFAFCTA